MATRRSVVLASQVLGLDINTITVVDHPDDFISLFDLRQSKVGLCATKLAVDAFIVGRSCVPIVAFVMLVSLLIRSVLGSYLWGRCSPVANSVFDVCTKSRESPTTKSYLWCMP